MTYSYDPTLIAEEGKDRMRFELGDTVIDGEGITSPLCDEEYIAIISSNKSWKRAKLALLEAIMMKLSYEVNTSVDGLSYSLSDRANRWREMYEGLKKELSCGVPTVNKSSIYGKDEPHYFHKNMQTNMNYPHEN